MARPPRGKSKHAGYDPDIFTAEPPENPKLIKSLFCGREDELRQGVEILRNYMDTGGKRSTTKDKRPWVIHGESRSGKSHLARRILLALPRSRKKRQICVSARERLQASAVMQAVFREMAGLFEETVSAVTLEAEDSQQQMVRVTREFLAQARRFEPGTESVTLDVTRGDIESSQVGAKLGLVPKVLEFFRRRQTAHSESERISLKLAPPQPADLAEYCVILADSLMRLKLLDHVLVLVDDVDLIEAYADAERNGRIERSILGDALVALHQAPGVDVLLTARSWYAYSKKEFKTLVDLATSRPLGPKELEDIYGRRFEAFARRTYQHGFLTDDALQRAATWAGNLPGVFLRHLDVAFEAYRRETDWDLRDGSWYLSVFRRVWDIYKGKYPTAADALTGAVQNGRLTLDVGETNPFYATVFDSELVVQSYYREKTYTVAPIVQQLIQMPPATDGQEQADEGASATQ